MVSILCSLVFNSFFAQNSRSQIDDAIDSGRYFIVSGKDSNIGTPHPVDNEFFQRAQQLSDEATTLQNRIRANELGEWVGAAEKSIAVAQERSLEEWKRLILNFLESRTFEASKVLEESLASEQLLFQAIKAVGVGRIAQARNPLFFSTRPAGYEEQLKLRIDPNKGLMSKNFKQALSELYRDDPDAISEFAFFVRLKLEQTDEIQLTVRPRDGRIWIVMLFFDRNGTRLGHASRFFDFKRPSVQEQTFDKLISNKELPKYWKELPQVKWNVWNFAPPLSLSPEDIEVFRADAKLLISNYLGNAIEPRGTLFISDGDLEAVVAQIVAEKPASEIVEYLTSNGRCFRIENENRIYYMPPDLINTQIGPTEASFENLTSTAESEIFLNPFAYQVLGESGYPFTIQTSLNVAVGAGIFEKGRFFELPFGGGIISTLSSNEMSDLFNHGRTARARMTENQRQMIANVIVSSNGEVGGPDKFPIKHMFGGGGFQITQGLVDEQKYQVKVNGETIEGTPDYIGMVLVENPVEIDSLTFVRGTGKVRQFKLILDTGHIFTWQLFAHEFKYETTLSASDEKVVKAEVLNSFTKRKEEQRILREVFRSMIKP